jgi:prepilin-type N-terminal cleavage/methylation domain-containing protein
VNLRKALDMNLILMTTNRLRKPNTESPRSCTPAALGRGLRAAEEANGFRQCSSERKAGFSLLEMMASIVILLVIVGGLVSMLSFFQQTYARTEVKSDMYENVRGAAELMEQEIGQAGLVNLPSPGPTLSAALSANVSSATSMFVGEQLLVDAGASNEELVTLSGVNAGNITAIFGKSHATGASLNVLGVFPNGIVVPGTGDGSTSVTEPGVSVLNLFGDINGDGSLVYVRYTCDTSTTPGTLARSVTTITPGVDTIGPSQTILSTLVPNPGGTPCFQYTTSTAGGDTFVTNVGITLSVETTRPDPQTGQYATMTKSFLNFSPRNVSAGFEWANNNPGNTTRLQATPANVLSY